MLLLLLLFFSLSNFCIPHQPTKQEKERKFMILFFCVLHYSLFDLLCRHSKCCRFAFYFSAVFFCVCSTLKSTTIRERETSRLGICDTVYSSNKNKYKKNIFTYNFIRNIFHCYYYFAFCCILLLSNYSERERTL